MDPKAELEKIIQELETQQFRDGEAKGLVKTIGDEIKTQLSPLFSTLAKDLTGEVTASLKDAIKGFKVDVPKSDAPVVNVSVPDIHVPEFNIPTPKVTVNVPKADAPVVNIPAPVVNFPSEMSLKKGAKPFPVIMIDEGGKPMRFPAPMESMGGGRGDFFAIRDIQTSSGASIIDQEDGAMKVVGSLSATLTLPSGPGDGATATRMIQAGDSVSSVNVLQINGNTPATGLNETTPGVLRVVHMTDTALSVNVISAVASGAVGQGDSASAARTIQAGDSVSSINVLQINGNTPATGLNETNSGVLRTILMSDTVSSVYVQNPVAQGDSTTALRIVHAGDVAVSVNVSSITGPIGPGDAAAALRVVVAGNAGASVSVIDFAGNTPALGTNETTNGVLRTISMSDTASSSQSKLIAMTSLPTAGADAASVFQRSDKLGREVNRPINVRDLIATAYATLTTSAETTLATAAAGQFLDLISVIFANDSTAAIKVSVRAVSGGNVLQTFQVPAAATTGWTPPVPWPQDATGNAWTFQNVGSDQSNTTISATALFSKES